MLLISQKKHCYDWFSSMYYNTAILILGRDLLSHGMAAVLFSVALVFSWSITASWLVCRSLSLLTQTLPPSYMNAQASPTGFGAFLVHEKIGLGSWLLTRFFGSLVHEQVSCTPLHLTAWVNTPVNECILQ